MLLDEFNSLFLQETRDPSLLIRAKSRIERILALEPDHLLAMTLLGTIYMDMGENNEAISRWNKVLSVIYRFSFDFFFALRGVV